VPFGLIKKWFKTPSLAKEHLHFSFVVLRFKQKKNILGIGLHDRFQSVELSGNSSSHGNSNSKYSYMGLGPFQAGYLLLNMQWINCTDPFPSVNNRVAILGSLGAAFSLVCISGWTHTKTVAYPFILAKSLNLKPVLLSIQSGLSHVKPQISNWKVRPRPRSRHNHNGNWIGL